jgi:hypothetical protein
MSIIISFIPIINSYLCLRHLIYLIKEHYRINTILRETDHIAKKVGFESMKHMIKEQSKKRK